MYIIFEGLDRTGKTSTRKKVEICRNGRDVMIDRFIGSNIVFGSIFKRYTDEEVKKLYFDESIFSFYNTTLLIYLYAPIEVIISRMKKTKHEKIDITILKKTKIEFDKYFKKSSFLYKIKIDTNKYNITEVSDLIMKEITKIESEIIPF